MNNLFSGKLQLMIFICALITGCFTVSDQYIFNGDNKADKEDYSGAIIDYTMSIEEDRTKCEAYIKRAVCYGKLHNYKESFKNFNWALRLEKKNAQIYYFMALVKEELGDYKGALNDSKTGLFYKKKKIFYAQIGKLLVIMDSCQEAKPYLDIALKRHAINSCFTKEELLFLKSKCQ